MNRFKLYDAFLTAFILAVLNSDLLSGKPFTWQDATKWLLIAVLAGEKGIRTLLSNPNKEQKNEAGRDNHTGDNES